MRDGILERKSLHVGAAADDDCVSSGRRGRRWKRFILLRGWVAGCWYQVGRSGNGKAVSSSSTTVMYN